MKQILFIVTALLLLTMLFVSAPQTHAALDATCTANPSTIGPYETTTVSCSGFDANTFVWAYTVEPDGATMAYCPDGIKGCQGLKTDKYGNVSFPFTDGIEPFFTRELGTWTFVVEQLGPGGTKAHQGSTFVFINGNGESVSGATLTASPSVVNVTQDVLTITGAGFVPHETINAWLQFPANCSSFALPIVFFANGKYGGNSFGPFTETGGGVHTLSVGSTQVDQSGSFVATLDLRNEPLTRSTFCIGQYRFVARALGSGIGGYVDFILTGGNVDVNASLVANKSSVNSMNDVITFSASGFDANETLSCWLTSPEGQAIPMYTIPSVSSPIRVDGNGAGVVWLYTGALREVAPTGDFIIPLQSQGALGMWAMSCRGNVSGRVGVANFLMVGGTLDP